MAPAGLKGTSVHRHGKSRAAIVAAATAAGMAAGGVLVADGPKDAWIHASVKDQPYAMERGYFTLVLPKGITVDD